MSKAQVKFLRLVENGVPTEGTREYDTFVELLRALLWEHSHRGWKTVAVEADLSVSTVQKFATGDTVSPYGRTLLKLLVVLGYRIAILPEHTPVLSEEITSTYKRQRQRA